MHWPFAKYSGCGNDFIIIDNRSKEFPKIGPLVTKLCARQQGIGADGVIFLENSFSADFRMSIFNADGSEAEMCGNGIRCLIKFAHSLGYHQNLKIQTMLGYVTASSYQDQIKVRMPSPKDMHWSIDFSLGAESWTLHYLDTGVPHAVIFTEEAENIDLETIGRKIRHHPRFAPRGTNVNFATIKEERVHIRTYERGVEQETLACGTGAMAVALAAAKVHHLTSPICIQTRSKEMLEISFTHEGSTFTNLIMTGPARFVFAGSIDLSDFN